MRPINVTRSAMPPFAEYCEEIRELWDSRWLTNMGVKHERLREEKCRAGRLSGRALHGHIDEWTPVP